MWKDLELWKLVTFLIPSPIWNVIIIRYALEDETTVLDCGDIVDKVLPYPGRVGQANSDMR